MISLRNIHKYYYSDTSVALGVRKINLEFEIGEFVAITGESGSGKSTLLNVISGMDTYEDGEMYVNGEPTSYFDDMDWENYRRTHISFIYQSYNLIDSYTVLENIESVLLICQDTFGAMSKKERQNYCMQYLEKVGLKKQARQRASHLSSGQKQRLSIARALAKNTDIIIADEPTGNLDSENGKQIIELLHDLSKEKLVIMVTHNYEQAAPYVTRKIRLYGGEVVEDIYPNRITQKVSSKIETETLPSAEQQNVHKSKQNSKNQNKKEKVASWSVAWQFVCRNRKAQPHRNFFLFLFLLLSSFAGVVFLGNFLANMDDTSTKIVSQDVFYNTDKNRLIIRRLDGEDMTQEDVKKVMTLKHVEEADLYDGVNDVNYFYKKNEDYKVNYETAQESLKNKIEPEFLDFTQFMRSASSLKEENLKAGSLPENENEIVLYSEEEGIIGEEITFYFQNTRYWKNSTSVCKKMKVCGILKENSPQVYFSTEFCKALNVRYVDYYTKAGYERIKEVKYTDKSQEDYLYQADKTFDAIFVPNAQLNENEMKLSQNYFLNITGEEKDYGSYTQREYIGEKGIISYGSSTKDYETATMKLCEEGNLSTDSIVEVSPEMFEKIYPSNVTRQMGVFIEDYAYTDDVIEQLDKAGYEAMSVFRISATVYDEEKVTQRFVTLGICSGALFIIFFLDVLVIYALMKLKRKDFMILKSLGMKQKVIVRMNILDLTSGVMLSQIISCVLAYVLAGGKVSYISSFLQYYHVSNWIFLWCIGLCMALVTAFVYNRYLKKRLCTSSGTV